MPNIPGIWGMSAKILVVFGAGFPMLARIAATVAALAFAIGAFCGAAPTDASRVPFGIFFLLIAAFIWFKWQRFKYGFDRPVMDDIAQSYWRSDGPKVPEIDKADPRRDRRD